MSVRLAGDIAGQTGQRTTRTTTRTWVTVPEHDAPGMPEISRDDAQLLVDSGIIPGLTMADLYPETVE